MSDSDILERAKKALIDDDMTYEDYDECISLLIAEVEANQIMLRQFQVHEDQTHAAMEGLLGNSDNFIELAREMKEEVGRLRSLENCVSLVIDRQGKTNAALLGQLDVISAYLDAELVEWKNGDQIAEIAIKFMDLQKQKLNDANSQIAAKDARIKELEEANRNIDKRRDEMAAFIERLEAAFLEAKRCPTCNGAGKLIDVVISRNLGRVESERVCPLCEGKWEEKAREALEEIKTGGKDEA